MLLELFFTSCQTKILVNDQNSLSVVTFLERKLCNFEEIMAYFQYSQFWPNGNLLLLISMFAVTLDELCLCYGRLLEFLISPRANSKLVLFIVLLSSETLRDSAGCFHWFVTNILHVLSKVLFSFYTLSVTPVKTFVIHSS